MKNKKNPSLSGALKYLGPALLLFFVAPIMMTIGFKALDKDQTYVLLIIGIILGILAILLAAKGIVNISTYLFNKDSEEV